MPAQLRARGAAIARTRRIKLNGRSGDTKTTSVPIQRPDHWLARMRRSCRPNDASSFIIFSERRVILTTCSATGWLASTVDIASMQSASVSSIVNSSSSVSSLAACSVDRQTRLQGLELLFGNGILRRLWPCFFVHPPPISSRSSVAFASARSSLASISCRSSAVSALASVRSSIMISTRDELVEISIGWVCTGADICMLGVKL